MIWQYVCISSALVWRPGGPGPVRAGHAATLLSDGSMWTFGGLDASGSATADMWKKSPGESTWELVEDMNDGPPPRMYASLTHAPGNTIVLCGGWDPGEKGSGGVFYDDIWTYDVGASAWSRSACSLPDGPVSRHTAHPLQDGRILFQTFRGTVCYQPDEDAVERQRTTGHAPLGFSMQSGAVCKDKVVLFGGATSGQSMTSDVYVLNTTSWHWSCFKTDHGPTPRASSSMAPLEDASGVIVFGGAGIPDEYAQGKGLIPTNEAWVLRVHDAGGVTWEACQARTKPPARVAAIMERSDLLSYTVHGGWDPQTGRTLGDTWALEL